MLQKAIEDERSELVALATSTESANAINREFNKMNDELDHIPDEMLTGNSDKLVADFLPSLREKLNNISQPPPAAQQPEESDSFNESMKENAPKKTNLAKMAFGTLMRRTVLLRMKSGSNSGGTIETQPTLTEETNEQAEPDKPPTPTTAPAPGTASMPAAGTMSFLGFSKFMVSLQKRMQRAMAPPELSEQVTSVSHNSVQFQITSDKSCTGDHFDPF